MPARLPTRSPVRALRSRTARSGLLLALAGALLVVIVPGTARATLECELPNDRRQLRIELPGDDHLCEVSVTYQSGERRVLWYADNDSLFCSEKLDQLEKKYTEDWGFTCGLWPSSDGIDVLPPKHRRALDRELLARLRSGSAPDDVRVASISLGQEGMLIAVQWLNDRADGLTVYRDTTTEPAAASWQSLADIDDLTASLPDEAYLDDPDLAIERALLTGIDESGTLAITTIVDGADRGSVCRGRQRLALDPQGELIARTPHRHVCESIGN